MVRSTCSHVVVDALVTGNLRGLGQLGSCRHRRTVMPHGVMNMMAMEDMCHRFAVSIGQVDRTRDVMELDVPICAPFLYSKVLDVNMASTRHWSIFIDDHNGRLIVKIKTSRARFREAKITEDHS